MDLLTSHAAIIPINMRSPWVIYRTFPSIQTSLPYSLPYNTPYKSRNSFFVWLPFASGPPLKFLANLKLPIFFGYSALLKRRKGF